MSKFRRFKKLSVPMAISVSAVVCMVSAGFSTWAIGKNHNTYEPVDGIAATNTNPHSFSLDKTTNPNGYDSFLIIEDKFLVDEMLTDTAKLTYYLSFNRGDEMTETGITFEASVSLKNQTVAFVNSNVVESFSCVGDVRTLRPIYYSGQSFISSLLIDKTEETNVLFSLSYEFNDSLIDLFKDSEESPIFSLKFKFLE